MRLFVLILAAVSVSAQQKDPAAWGSSHAGKPLPTFITGDECLFCHEKDVAPSWPKNAHSRATRPDAPELKDRAAELGKAGAEVTHYLGGKNYARFLKQNGYGKMDLLSAVAKVPEGWVTKDAQWDQKKYFEKCAGCHTSGVDAKTGTFLTTGIDCFTCHGVVDLNHSNDLSLMWLSKKKRSDTQAIESICASCHLRGMAQSKTTGRPYPDNFVAGDNLFIDYQVDFSKVDDPNLNPGDKHVLRNVRDVVVNGSDTTCLSCHQVHFASSTEKHRRVLTNEGCQDCHMATGPKKVVKKYEVHSALCEY
jgi:hypothetical protein